MNVDDMYHKLVAAGDAWADALHLAQELEEKQKPLLSQLVQDAIAAGETGAAKAEHSARATIAYSTHIEAMVAARRDANKARVRYDSMKTLADMRRTEAATKRAEMGNLR